MQEIGYFLFMEEQEKQQREEVNVELEKIGYTNKYVFFENEEEAYLELQNKEYSKYYSELVENKNVVLEELQKEYFELVPTIMNMVELSEKLRRIRSKK